MADLTGRWIGLRPLQSSSPTARGRTMPTVRPMALADPLPGVAARPCAPSDSDAPMTSTGSASHRPACTALRMDSLLIHGHPIVVDWGNHNHFVGQGDSSPLLHFEREPGR